MADLICSNPQPIESILNRDPHVACSVFFGRGQFNAGVLIDPASEHIFDPINTMQLEDFRNKIWSAMSFHEMVFVDNNKQAYNGAYERVCTPAFSHFQRGHYLPYNTVRKRLLKLSS
jgi:hypothetical protein